MKTKWLFLSILTLAFLSMLVMNVKAENSLERAANVEVGVWLVNVEKVDLAASSYKLDYTCGLSSILPK